MPVNDHIIKEVFDHVDLPILGHDEIHGTSNMIEVPMLFWFSKAFKREHPHLIKQIAAAAHLPYMTDDLIHTILDIVHLSHVKDFEAQRSIINKQFNRKRKRVYHNQEYVYNGTQRYSC